LILFKTVNVADGEDRTSVAQLPSTDLGRSGVEVSRSRVVTHTPGRIPLN
jgi:hypothetical protein